MKTLTEYYALADSDAPVSAEDSAAVAYARVDIAWEWAVEHNRPRPVGRAASWCYHARQLRDISAELQRVPRQTDDVPAAVRHWVNYQRRNAKRLNGFQVAVLESISGWVWAPWDDGWDDRLNDFTQFVESHQRMPRARANEESERLLARWVERQRRRIQQQALPYARQMAFDTATRVLVEARTLSSAHS